MALSITIRGAEFTRYVDASLPFYPDALGFYLLGGTLQSTLKNLAENEQAEQAAAIGGPSISDGFATLNKDNYIDTGIILNTYSGSYTLISACDIKTTARQPLMGNWYNDLRDVMLDRDPNLRFATRGSAQNLNPITNSTLNEIMFHAGVKNGNASSSYLKTPSGMQSQTGGIGTFSEAVPKPIIIGPHGGLGTQSEADEQRHSAAIIYNRALTSVEINTVYEFLKFKLLARGVNLI